MENSFQTFAQKHPQISNYSTQKIILFTLSDTLIIALGCFSFIYLLKYSLFFDFAFSLLGCFFIFMGTFGLSQSISTIVLHYKPEFDIKMAHYSFFTLSLVWIGTNLLVLAETLIYSFRSVSYLTLPSLILYIVINLVIVFLIVNVNDAK